MNADLLLNTDTADSIQGHVGPNTKQVFTTLTANPFKFPKLKLEGYEFLQIDQFGNHYFKMRALLADGELYDVDQYVKPSMMMRTGGGHADFEDKTAKTKLRITDDLFKELRDQGKLILARTNLDVMKAKSLSQSPVAIEAKDITAAASQLEDKIKAAKEAAGEWVEDVKTPPPEEPAGQKILPFVVPGPTEPPMHSTAQNIHHHTKSPHDHNAAHGTPAAHNGKTGNKFHDAGMGQSGLENMKGGATGTPKKDTYRGAGKPHAHGNGT